MKRRNERIAIAALWTFALILGAIETWWTRHRIFSDGISYLEIATNYLDGNWRAALNAYWSPLYSWVLAIFFAVLHPAPYWQVATLHLINFLAYAAGLWACSRLIREFLYFRSDAGLSRWAIFAGSYACYVFAGLYLVGVGYVSPDMIALFLTITIATLILRVHRTGGSLGEYVLLGVFFGALFLTRTAFAAMSPAFLLAIVFSFRSCGRGCVKPVLVTCACYLLIIAPFVIALSLKEHRVTLGDSGKLNYGWEVSGAARSIHWQGEPYDIGKPLHPTRLALKNPNTYLFDGPVPGSYSPWHDPSFWYAGIQPRVRPVKQIKVFFFNAGYCIFLLFLSPVFPPCLLIALLAGIGAWSSKLLSFWLVLLPCVAGTALYCLVFVDKRYIAGFLVVFWMAALVSVDCIPLPWKPRASQFVIALSLLSLIGFAVRLHQPIRLALADLAHHNEAEANLNFTLAKRLRELGLKPGDEIAFIGLTINADWARLDHLRIIGEVPLRYVRHWNFWGSRLEDDGESIRAFWHADPGKQQRVLDVFRAAGAKMVLTDAYPSGEALQWQRVLPPGQKHLPVSGGKFADQQYLRFYRLTP